MSSVMASVRAVARETIPKPPRKSPISLTQAAISRLSHLHSTRHTTLKNPLPNNDNPSTNEYIKISLRTKGCSGNAYVLDWTSTKEKLDEEVKATSNLSVLIDSKALFSLLGSQMDYITEPLSSGFVFNNPNVKETCGCGMSFIV